MPLNYTCSTFIIKILHDKHNFSIASYCRKGCGLSYNNNNGCIHTLYVPSLPSLSDSRLQTVIVLSNDPLASLDPSQLQPTEWTWNTSTGHVTIAHVVKSAYVRALAWCATYSLLLLLESK